MLQKGLAPAEGAFDEVYPHSRLIGLVVIQDMSHPVGSIHHGLE